jgi:hypothetical protein
VNTFRNPHGDPIPEKLELARSTEEEKRSQLARLEAFQGRNAAQAQANGPSLGSNRSRHARPRPAPRRFEDAPD